MKKIDKLFYSIRSDCLDLIAKKGVDIDSLSFRLGISKEEFISNFQSRNKDFSFYLKTYDLLLEW